MRRLLPLLMLATGSIFAMLSVCASVCHAGILVPQQVTFDEGDLAASLATRSSTSTATSTTSSSSPSRRTSHEWPADERDQPTNPLELVKSPLPTGTSSP